MIKMIQLKVSFFQCDYNADYWVIFYLGVLTPIITDFYLKENRQLKSELCAATLKETDNPEFNRMVRKST